MGSLVYTKTAPRIYVYSIYLAYTKDSCVGRRANLFFVYT
jgi:hypothetical protein